MLQLLRRMMNVIMERQFDETNQISLFYSMDDRGKEVPGGIRGLQVEREDQTMESTRY